MIHKQENYPLKFLSPQKRNIDKEKEVYTELHQFNYSLS